MNLRTSCLPLLLAFLLLPGCVSLKREPPRKRMFGLEVERPSALRLRAEGVVLRIRTARIALQYDSRGFVYRRGDGTWESDFHNEFFASPAALMTEQVRRWLVRPPGALRVVGEIDRERATYILSIRVNALFGDYPDEGSRRAVLEMEFAIDAAERSAEAVSFERGYRREIPLEEPGADALVGGWDRALEAILTEFVGDLNDLGLSATDD